MNNMVSNTVSKAMTLKSILCAIALTSVSYSSQVFAIGGQAEEATSQSASANLVDQKNPYKMIEEVASLTFKRFADEQENIRKNPNILKDIVREELMPYVNYQYSAFKVVGQHLRNTTKEERSEFVPVFKEYLITSYAQVFTLYDNQQVIFERERDFKDNKIIAVNTRVIMPGRDDIDVSFKVRRNTKDDTWQAFDMIAEGVSLLDSKQAELGSIIRQKGLAYVTELLKKKSERNIVFKDGADKDAVVDSFNDEKG
ncbi:ABC transporter substrate-binding protein [Colwellia asteriadis]|uniref:ABC transporter substrate-binding protein n=1 Tax=Colwellia asteriadis TaxID=517723 RepID=A0ABN1L3P7_9GAMM